MKVLLRDKNGNSHPVEDILLAVQSKVLRSCFNYSDSTEVIDLPIEGDVLKKIIAWVHRPQPETLELDKAADFFECDLLVASEYLDIPLLSRQIISWMVQQFSPGNIQLQEQGLEWRSSSMTCTTPTFRGRSVK